ncbi:hypothetical protein EDC04DRAFT_2612063 [Pisolithus marmoratus]|nr:hypothetical protein EDC04DRAFT_2612063 [Pisolithus marmoratus]
MNALEAPDKCSQCASKKVEEGNNLLELSSETLESPGDLPDTTSECAKTQTGHRKPEDEVVDMQHVVDVLPMFEVGSTGQAQYSKHVKELQASDGGSQHASDEVEESQDLPKSSSEVLKPAAGATKQTSRCSIENVSTECNEHIPMDGKTIANVPDPLGIHVENPAPHTCWNLLVVESTSCTVGLVAQW